MLDDAQWSDRETLDWLRHLLHFGPRARFLVLLAVRPEEVAPEHPLAGLLLELRSRGTLTDIPLEPLGVRETAALATQLVGRASEAELERLYRESEGNPLFVVEMVRAGLSLEPAASDPSDPSQRALPPRLQALLQTRLRQLSPAARDLAGLAATIGRDFTFGVLAEASDLAETLFVRSLDELWQRWIVREQGASAYDFSHDKLRDAAYATVSAARRRLLHRRVAEALEAVHASDLEAVSARIAGHFERADLPDRAIPHLQRAAEAAQRVYANEDAIASLERALALLKTLPQGRRKMNRNSLCASPWASRSWRKGITPRPRPPKILCGHWHSVRRSTGHPTHLSYAPSPSPTWCGASSSGRRPWVKRCSSSPSTSKTPSYA